VPSTVTDPAPRVPSFPQLRRTAEGLLESELFGHVREPSPRRRRQKGLIEEARGGTIFSTRSARCRRPASTSAATLELARSSGGDPPRAANVDRARDRGTTATSSARRGREASVRTSSTASTCCPSASPRCASGAEDIPLLATPLSVASLPAAAERCRSRRLRRPRSPPTTGPATVRELQNTSGAAGRRSPRRVDRRLRPATGLPRTARHSRTAPVHWASTLE